MTAPGIGGGPTHPVIERDLHYEEKGSGPLLLCLHGIGSSSLSFAPQMEALSANMRVVAWDAPGYGASPPPDLTSQNPAESAFGGPGIAWYADAAAGLICRLGGPAFVLGVSWGGVVAAEMALRHPDLLHGLLLVSASRGSGRDESSAAAMEQRITDLERLGPDEFAARRAPALLAPDAPTELIAQVAHQMAAGLRPDGHRLAAQAMAVTDLSERLGLIDVPAIVLCGSEDRVTGVPESEAIAARIPHSTLVVVHRCGHLVNQEAPEIVNEWVASFASVILGSGEDKP